jgi:YegS/Rv2252/BmrU family lipid kinase
MNHLFIVNPKAGKANRAEKFRDNVEAIMKKHGEQYKIVTTEYARHATEIAGSVLSGGGDWKVYSCGGDGTLNEVVNGAAGFKNAAVTHIPIGTGNDFIRLFEENMTRFNDIAELLDSDEREIDLIEADGRYSVNICSTGFDARVAAEVYRFKKIPLITPFAAYSISAVYNIFLGISRKYAVEVDGREYNGDYSLIVAANARYYGGGYTPIPTADPTDRQLDFLLIDKVSRFEVLRLIKLYSKGRYAELGGIATYLQGHKMKIRCIDGPTEINADGEISKNNSFSFELSDTRLRFFAPKGAFDFLDKRK